MSDADSLPQKRRSRAGVTKNACTECQKRKARCDGRRPCSRCAGLEGVICHYAVSVRTSKESMRADIVRLQIHHRTSENVLGLLALGYQSDFILQSLREGHRIEDISNSLDMQAALATTSPSDRVFWPPSLEPSRKGSWSTTMGSSSDEGTQGMQKGVERSRLGQIILGEGREDQYHRNGHQWTAVTADKEVIEHLLSLFFCWEYPTFACLSKRYFLDDFRTGVPRYCSSLLVNIILCLGCRFSDQPETGVNPKQFFAEAERLLILGQENPSLTTIQAINLMSIWEACCGREYRSWSYARQSISMAVEMCLHTELDDIEVSNAEHEVRSITYWGAFTLDQAWSLSMGLIPYISRKGVHVQAPDVIEAEEQNIWTPYTDDGLHVEWSLHQPSNVRWVYRGLCELSDIIHDSLHILYTPTRPLTSQDVLNVYTNYLCWYDSLPVALRRGENSTPAVLFVHMYYHFAMLLLFGPFIKVRFTGSSISPNEICIQAADAITSLVCSYRQLYSLRRAPCFVPYIVLASSIAQLVAANSSPNIGTFTQIILNVTHLHEMTLSHGFSSRATQILRTMAHNWNVMMLQESEGEPRNDPEETGGMRNLLVKFFSVQMENSPPSRSQFTEISIFSPFPAQTPPFPAFKKQLERDGFILPKGG